MKRLAASFAIAGRDRGFAARSSASGRRPRRRRGLPRGDARASPRCATSTSGTRGSTSTTSLAELARGRRRQAAASACDKNVAKAHAKDEPAGPSAKLTEMVDGEPRIAQRPAGDRPVEELLAARPASGVDGRDRRGCSALYRATPPGRPPAPARAVTATSTPRARSSASAASAPAPGSCCCSAATETTRCSCSSRRPRRRCSSRYSGASEYEHHGQRVVEGQRLMQAASDILLGWVPATRRRRRRARLLRPPALGREGLGASSRRWTRGASRSTRRSAAGRWRAPTRAPATAIAIAAYLGNGDSFDRAIAEFAEPTPTRTSATSTHSGLPSSRESSRSRTACQ